MSDHPTVLTPPVLEASRLSKTFRRGPELVHALRSIDLAVDGGEVVGLTGPSGSGKTTLLNVLCGWESPDSGEICLRGSSVESPAALPWRELAVVAQDLALMAELSVQENVALPLRLSKDPPEDLQRVSDLLERLGLAALAPRLPEEASLGEQQRAAVARALVVRPAILLADEPFGHQDEGWTKAVVQIVREAADAGTACLIATHDPETWPLLDRIVALRDGAVVPP